MQRSRRRAPRRRALGHAAAVSYIGLFRPRNGFGLSMFAAWRMGQQGH